MHRSSHSTVHQVSNPTMSDDSVGVEASRIKVFFSRKYTVNGSYSTVSSSQSLRMSGCPLTGREWRCHIRAFCPVRVECRASGIRIADVTGTRDAPVGICKHANSAVLHRPHLPTGMGLVTVVVMLRSSTSVVSA